MGVGRLISAQGDVRAAGAVSVAEGLRVVDGVLTPVRVVAIC